MLKGERADNKRDIASFAEAFDELDDPFFWRHQANSLVVLVTVDEPSSYGVVDEVARRTLLAGGRVVAVRADEVPGGGEAAAILRYA